VNYLVVNYLVVDYLVVMVGFVCFGVLAKKLGRALTR
jgi:hypothetical protein